MTTAFRRVVEVKHVEGQSNAVETLYTVPSTRYALVYPNYLRNNTSSGSLSFTFGSVSTGNIAGSTTINFFSEYPFLLFSGQTITKNDITTGLWDIVVEEFNKP